MMYAHAPKGPISMKDTYLKAFTFPLLHKIYLMILCFQLLLLST